jgi:hypothetical protein
MATVTRTRHSIAVVGGPGPLLGLQGLAREAGLHPQVVRALIGLGLIEPRGGTAAAPLFAPEAAAELARAGRLRRDLGLNYAGAVLACELLARIDELEERLQRSPPVHGHEVMRWTRTV